MDDMKAQIQSVFDAWTESWRAHNQRDEKRLAALLTKERKNLRICKVEGCTNYTQSKKNPRCSYHYNGKAPGARMGKGARRRRGCSARSSITDAEFTAILDSQEGLCFLCKHLLYSNLCGRPRDKETERIASVDHCHIIEKTHGIRASIRGILCLYPCNRILRQEMTSEWLRRGADYVEQLPAQRILNP